MYLAKVFTNSHSQMIRLPKEYRLQDNEVFVKKHENMLILIPKNSIRSTFIFRLREFSDDFMSERGQN